MTTRETWRERAATGRFWAFYLIAGFILIGLYEFVPPIQGTHYVINLVGLSAPIAIIAGVWLYQPRVTDTAP